MFEKKSEFFTKLSLNFAIKKFFKIIFINIKVHIEGNYII